MKLFYINVMERNAGWGAEWFMNNALLHEGVQTITLDYRKHRGHLSRKFLETEGDFDAFLLQRGDYFPMMLIKAIRRPRFFWATELVSRRPDQDVLFDSGLFDHVFVRGENCRNTLIRRGMLRPDQISILLSGFDQKVHRPIDGAQKDIDVLFVGSQNDRRKRIIDELRNDFNITAVSAFGEDMVRLLNRAKIVLNIHAGEYIDTETRVYEALGCGALLITEKLGDENPFLNGVHLVEVSGIAEMKDKIALYLKNDEMREKIALDGFHEAVQKHTYEARARQLMATIGNYLDDKNKGTMPPIDKEPIDKEAVRSYLLPEKIDFMRFIMREKLSRLIGKKI